MTAVLLLAHAGVGALWLGAMAYSLFTVQPKIAAMVGGDPERVEDAQRVLAHGNRRPVVGLIAALWVTGIALAFTGAAHPATIVIKAALLAAASGLFWWVSWRGWPRRVFALPAELPALQRRFRIAALAMFGLVGAAFAISYLG